MRRLIAIVGILMAAGILCGAAGLAILWFQHKQSVTLPQPSGLYPVGRMDFDWRDPSRIDPFAPAAGTPRELTVWVWYPAIGAGGHGPAEYEPAPLRNALLRHMGPPLRLLTHDLARVHAHATRDANVSNAKATYPVVLFKPGIGALTLDYTSLAEDLASHGYIVAASDSPYSTAVVVYQDGRMVSRNRAGHPPDEGAPEPSQQTMNNVLRVWVDDEHFIVAQLERLNAGVFSGRLNLASVGAFGHSFGGAAALQFCVEDARCKAAIDVDGIPFGDVVRGANLSKPLLFILSDHSNEPAAETGPVHANIDAIRQQLPNRDNYLVLAGSRHFNFSDMALTKNTRIAKVVGLLGPIDERQALATTSQWIRSFFDRYLH